MERGSPISLFTAYAPATAEAAEEPSPLPNGIFLWISISMPRSVIPRWRRRSRAATPAVFPSTRFGSLPLSPVILVIRRPGLSECLTVISSPGESMANPRTSYPQATLATVAGAKTVISLGSLFVGVLLFCEAAMLISCNLCFLFQAITLTYSV